MQIRRAVLADVPWLLDQLVAFDRFYGAKHSLVPTDPAVATAVVTGLVTDPLFVFFVAERADVGPVGFICGLLTQHNFNPELTVFAELLWWVDPAHRGSTAGARLLEHFTAFGRANAKQVTMTLESTSPIDDRVLRKRGFVPHERSLLLEV